MNYENAIAEAPSRVPARCADAAEPHRALWSSRPARAFDADGVALVDSNTPPSSSPSSIARSLVRRRAETPKLLMLSGWDRQEAGTFASTSLRRAGRGSQPARPPHVTLFFLGP